MTLLGPAWACLGPMLGLCPMLASVRTMLTHVASRSGLGQERGRGCSCACLCSASCLLLSSASCSSSSSRACSCSLFLFFFFFFFFFFFVFFFFFFFCFFFFFFFVVSCLVLFLFESHVRAQVSILWLSWAQLGPVLAPCYAYVGLCCPYLGPILAPCWPILALSWPHVGPSWPYVGPRLAYVGPSLAHVGPMLAHLGAYVGASLGVFLAIYVATPSKCQLVRFFPLPRAQNHVKTTVFQHRQDKIRGRRGPRNTVKNDVFEPYTQNTV